MASSKVSAFRNPTIFIFSPVADHCLVAGYPTFHIQTPKSTSIVHVDKFLAQITRSQSFSFRFLRFLDSKSQSLSTKKCIIQRQQCCSNDCCRERSWGYISGRPNLLSSKHHVKVCVCKSCCGWESPITPSKSLESAHPNDSWR